MYTTNTLHHPHLFRTLPYKLLFKSCFKQSPSHLRPTRCSIDGEGGGDASNSRTPIPASLDITPEETAERRVRRRGSRRRRRVQNETPEMKINTTAETPKRWEEMSVTEKVLELYVGEKGLLFWLNKFAYASIFIVIGGWVLFRFVGPWLNLYKLDSPPLAPESMFKASS